MKKVATPDEYLACPGNGRDSGNLQRLSAMTATNDKRRSSHLSPSPAMPQQAAACPPANQFWFQLKGANRQGS